MGWIAEILRKEHRVCGQCGMGPTHVYDPEPGAGADEEAGDAAGGAPLCNGCLAQRLEGDMASFPGRALVFEPALGPDSLIFRPLEGASSIAWPADQAAAVRRSLDDIKPRCDTCGGAGRFLWIPVESDANLWGDDWLPGLMAGTLSAGASLCGACAARRLMRSIEERGLYYDAIVPPRGGDGALCGCES
jgi:hypothetical protein